MITAKQNKVSTFFMSVSDYLEYFNKLNVFLFSYFPFLFQLKSKHNYYNNNNIRLLRILTGKKHRQVKLQRLQKK